MNCIKKYLETREGRYSFYFEDLRSGYSYGYNENVSMTAAGCMKLPIAISLIKAKEDKKVNFMDKIKVLNNEKVYGTGIIHEFDDRDYTLFELMVIMLIQSDNTAANKIIYGWYNNGDTISGDGNDLTSYANWIDRHIKEPEIRKILKDDHIDYNDTYYLSEIILPLIRFVFREDFLEKLASQEIEGDIYECQGRIYN